MAKRIRHLVLLTAAVTLIVPIARSENDPPPLRSVEFHLLDHSRIRNIRFGVFDETGRLTGSSRTGFPTSGLSRRYHYEGPMPITFFEENRIPQSDGTERIERTPMARVDLPEDQSEVMLLFLPNLSYPQQGLRYTIQWIDIRPGALPPGHLGIYNTTALSYIGAVGRPDNNTRTSTIAPGLNAPLPIHPRAALVIAIKTENEELIRLYENTFECDTGKSLLFVVFPPRFPGSIHLGGKLVEIPLRQPPEPDESD